MKNSTRLAAVAATLVAVPAFAAGAVIAQHDTTTIHGCVRNGSGALRVVDDPGRCMPSETPLDWSIQGPAGPQGPAGADGADGATGQRGATGPQGPAGTAVAYARVATDGTVSQDSGNISVEKVANGTYCVSVSDATVHVAVASLDGRVNTGGSVQPSVIPASACPADHRDIFVVTRDHDRDDGFPGQDKAFYILVS